MSARICEHIRSNVAAYLVAFLALTVSPVLAAGDAQRAPVKKNTDTAKPKADGGGAGALAAPATDLTCALPCVQTAEIEDAAITMPKLASLAVTSAKIARNAVRSSKILDGSVGLVDVNAAEIQSRVGGTCAAGSSIRNIAQDGTVTCETDDAGGTATDLNCAAQCVQVGEIADSNVTSDKIAENNVRTGDVLDGSLTGNDVENGTIGSLDTNATQVQLRVGSSCVAGQAIRAIAQDGTVTCEVDDTGGGGPATDLTCTGCVQTADLADLSVSAAKLAGGAVSDSTKIAPFAILGTDIGLQTITGQNLQTGTVGSAQVADGSLTGGDVQNESLTGLDVGDGTITGSDVVESSLSGVDTCGSGTTRLDSLCVRAENLHRPWDEALVHCANLGLRLPTLGEALQLAQTHDVPNVDDSEFFWTDQLEFIEGGPYYTAEKVSDAGAYVAEFRTSTAETACVETPTSN